MIYEFKKKMDSYEDIMCEFGEMNLDIIQFEANMFNTFADRDYTSLQALDESSLQIINEATFKEAFDKLVSFIDSIMDKIREVIRKIITNLQVKFDSYGKFAKKMEERMNNSEWNDHKESYYEINFNKVINSNDWKSMTDEEFSDTSGMIMYLSLDIVKNIREYIDTGKKSGILAADNPRQFINVSIGNLGDGSNNNSLYDTAKSEFISKKTAKVRYVKKDAVNIIDSLKGAKSHLQKFTSVSKNIMNTFSDMKKEVSKLRKDEDNEDTLKKLADIQKVISVYSSGINSCLNASYSGLGYTYNQYMKALKTIVDKCTKEDKN